MAKRRGGRGGGRLPRDSRGRFLSSEEAKAARALSSDAAASKTYSSSAGTPWRNKGWSRRRRTTLEPELKAPTLTRREALSREAFGRYEIVQRPPLLPKFPRPLTLYVWRFRGANSVVRAEALITRLLSVQLTQSIEAPSAGGLTGRVVVHFREGGTWGSRVYPLGELLEQLDALSSAYEGEVSGVDVYVRTFTPLVTSRQEDFPRRSPSSPKPKRAKPSKRRSAPRSTSKPGGGSQRKGNEKLKFTLSAVRSPSQKKKSRTVDRAQARVPSSNPTSSRTKSRRKKARGRS